MQISKLSACLCTDALANVCVVGSGRTLPTRWSIHTLSMAVWISLLCSSIPSTMRLDLTRGIRHNAVFNIFLMLKSC